MNDDTFILQGTDDPTSVAKDAPRGSIYLRDTGSAGEIYSKDDNGSSTNWTLNNAGGGGVTTGQEIIVHTLNGFGSTDTKIPRFSTIDTNVGSDMTLVNDSATLGTTVTINTTGIYSMTIFMFTTSGGGMSSGFSKNAADRTANISGLTNTERLAVERAAPVSGQTQTISCSWTGNLTAADIIRPHTNADATATNGNNLFQICRIG